MVKGLWWEEHFSVDGTLMEAWVSQKSFGRKDGSGDDDDGENLDGEKRKNDTDESMSDANSRFYGKVVGWEVKLCYMGDDTMEKWYGLVVVGMVTYVNGIAERGVSEMMLKVKGKAEGYWITVGEDKAYDTADDVANLRAINVTPHVTQNQAVTKTGKTRSSAIEKKLE